MSVTRAAVEVLPPLVRRALVSVSDKAKLDVLARALLDHGVEVLSTGGTYKALVDLGVPCIKVSDYTGAAEILDGRVKTLHPKIHGGILARPTAEHERELALHGLSPIDLVVVNLYPFRQTVERPDCTFADAIENIDVGGPTMVRAAAKNWERVTIVVDPDDYVGLAEALQANQGRVPEAFRRAQARKAFAHTASYDAAIADYLARHDDEGKPLPLAALPSTLYVVGETSGDLRYGENPHQAARFYAVDDPTQVSLRDAVLHQGKPLSYNNLLDADGALNAVLDLAGLGLAAVVFKHVSPCGAALAPAGQGLAAAYLRAREADSESAFGGIVALSDTVDESVAQRLVETFLEVVLAPAFTPEALQVLGQKRNLRVMSLPRMAKPAPQGPAPLRMRSIAGGLLAQREDVISVHAAEAHSVSSRPPTAAEYRELEFAQRVCKHVRSNAIVLSRDGVTVGIGGGQTSRVEAVRQAMARAGDRARGAVMASDAFFPFRDSMDLAASVGLTAIVQPGGSMRDEEVIAAASEHGLAMLFTGERHFRH